MKYIKDFVPHLHVLFLLYLGFLITWKLNVFLRFIKEVLSEQNTDGSVGKGSSKRVILVLICFTFVYGVLYALHIDKEFDHYIATIIIVFLLLGLAIVKPDQANNLLDKLKSLTTFSTSKEITNDGAKELTQKTELKSWET